MAEARGVWGLHLGNGLRESFRRGVKGLTLDSCCWPFLTPRCSHTCPRPWVDPLEVPYQTSKPPPNKEPLPLVRCGWALAQRASTADVQYIYRPLAVPILGPNTDRCLPCARPPAAAAPALVLTASPVMEPVEGLLIPEQLRCSLEHAVLPPHPPFPPSIFPDSFRDSFRRNQRNTNTCHPVN